MEYDKDKVDETILALLWLTRWEDESGGPSVLRTWKGHDFEHMNRLHEEGYISDPRSNAKSVVFTDKGRERAEQLFHDFFGTSDSDGS